LGWEGERGWLGGEAAVRVCFTDSIVSVGIDVANNWRETTIDRG